MDIDKINIFKLNSKEWKKFKKIRLEALKLEPKAFISTFDECILEPDQYWKNKLLSKNELNIFAKKGSRIIGTMNATFCEKDEPSDTVIIHGAYVIERFRGKGIGKKMIHRLIREIKKNKKIKRIKLWVRETQTPAIRIYEKAGFTYTSRAGKHTVILEKFIS